MLSATNQNNSPSRNINSIPFDYKSTSGKESNDIKFIHILGGRGNSAITPTIATKAKVKMLFMLSYYNIYRVIFL